MRLTPSDPDIQTIITRIHSNEIDLQPEFQRGEVWSINKKQRLIDSILRDWHIPPLHVIIDSDTGQQLVLDGQQRMAAIRDFVEGQFTVDGNIEPVTKELSAEHGKRYATLRPDIKRRFDQFTIRVFRITDYLPEEPGELFYRLNQPTALTAAEQRNAFFGETRKQVKELVHKLEVEGLDDKFWGFSNARMAYDDIISRAALFLEQNTLKKKISAGTLADRFRSGKSFSATATNALDGVISLLGAAKTKIKHPPQLNKATAQSWLIFFSATKLAFDSRLDENITADFISKFEAARNVSNQHEAAYNLQEQRIRAVLFRAYEDRSTSRVADVLSVQVRDFVLWGVFSLEYKNSFYQHESIKKCLDMIDTLNAENLENPSVIEKLVSSSSWGETLWQ